MSEELLTIAEVAELLRLNQQTVYNWVHRGEVPAVRVGQRRVRIRRSDLDAFLGPPDERSEAVTTPPPREQMVPMRIDPAVIQALRQFGEAAGNLADALEQANSPQP